MKLILIALAVCMYQAIADIKKGAEVYKTYCSSCHGPEGAGLIGPNLTDKEILHGSEKADIMKVVANGVPGKAMPPWAAILKKDEISDVADFVKSIMGKNLKGPEVTTNSTVTPFPKGDLARPYLIRTFMPKMGLSDEVFANHGKGRETAKYSAGKGSFDAKRKDKPIDGIPGAIAVNFGEKLSYCFDSTECRLLYTWSGKFLDMTNYWGKGVGGGRKRFGYIAKVIGSVGYVTEGKNIFSEKPQFKGYSKVNGAPKFMYSLGSVDFTLKIVPGTTPGEAICHYTSNATNDLSLNFSKADQLTSDKGSIKDGKLNLSAAQAKSFTITIKPKK